MEEERRRTDRIEGVEHLFAHLQMHIGLTVKGKEKNT